MTQHLSDEIGIEYGIKNTWRVALVAPDGEILYAKGLGYSSTVAAKSVAIRSIVEFLELDSTTWCGKNLVLRGPSQMLSLNALKEWHNFRLAWGDEDPLSDYADEPNGRDYGWTLYFCSNGRNQPILTGELPEGWWEQSDDDHYHYLQNVL